MEVEISIQQMPEFIKTNYIKEIVKEGDRSGTSKVSIFDIEH